MVVDWAGILSPDTGGSSSMYQARRVTHGMTEPVLGPVRRVLRPVRVGSVSIDLAKTPNPLNIWANEIAYTVMELESAAQTGRLVCELDDATTAAREVAALVNEISRLRAGRAGI